MTLLAIFPDGKGSFGKVAGTAIVWSIHLQLTVENTVEKIWLRHYDEAVPTSIDYPDIDLYSMFRQAVEEHPRGTATRFFGGRTRFGELGEKVDRFASVLASLGVKKGDRVALILPNMPLYPIAHFAVLKLGAVLVPTNPLYVERELQYQLSDSGAETVVVLDKLLGRLLAVRDKTPVKRIISAGIQEFLPAILGILYGLKNRSSEPPPKAPGLYEYRELMKRKVPSREAAEVSPEDTAILLYTGGTTGLSKGATLTHRNLVCNVHQTKSWLSDLQVKKEVFLCALPFFHSYGLTTGLHLAVLCRCTMILLPRVDLADVVKRIRKHRPTIFCGVPAMYNAINNYTGITSSDLSSIRLCVSGGAGLPSDVQARFEEMSGGKLVEGYGLSEASPLVSVNPIFGNRKNGTIGVPVADTDARIVDGDTGEILPQGEVGELSVSGPQVMQGYWNKREETANVLQDGWLKTGDMAVMDEDGYFTIVDRKKDLILSAGMNIYSREVEEVLYQHPGVQDAAVVGVPSKVRGEVPKAFIVLKEGHELTRRDVIRFCHGKLARFKIPRHVEFRDELPKSAIGKILKRLLKD